jgi:uncharacterized MnhB-related membrane protein
MTKRSWGLALNGLILAVACHSIAGGILLLFFPMWTLRLAGWGYAGEAFWPSQAGLFLALLGSVYALAIRLRALIWFLIASKACAFVFLVLSVVLLKAPKVVLTMAIGDGLMGLCVALAFWKQTRAHDQA